MKIKNVLIVSLTVVLAMSSAASALNLFDWHPGARPMALAGAYSAVGDDPAAISWNPAGLALMSRAGILTGYTNSFSDVSHYYLAGAAPALYGTLGAYLINASLGSIPVATVGLDGRPLVTDYYSDTQWLFGLAYSQELLLKGFNVGGTLKGYQHKIYQNSTSGFGFDLGALYDLGQSDIIKGGFPVKLGLVAQNVLQPKLSWPSGYSDTVSRRVFVGASYDGRVGDSPFTLSASLNPMGGSPKLWGVGAEYYLTNYLPLRIGYGNFYGSPQLALGVGLVYQDWGLDVAYKNHPDLGSNFQLSLSWRPDFKLFSMKPAEAAAVETVNKTETTLPDQPVVKEPAQTEPVAETETTLPDQPVVEEPAPVSEQPAAAQTIEPVAQPVEIADVLEKFTLDISASGKVQAYTRLRQPYFNVQAVSFVSSTGEKVSLSKSNSDDLFWIGTGRLTKKFEAGKLFIKLADGTVLYQPAALNADGQIAQTE